MSTSRTVFQNRGSIHTSTCEGLSTSFRAKFREVLALRAIARAKHFGRDRAMTALEKTLVNGIPLPLAGVNAIRGARESHATQKQYVGVLFVRLGSHDIFRAAGLGKITAE